MKKEIVKFIGILSFAILSTIIAYSFVEKYGFTCIVIYGVSMFLFWRLLTHDD